MQGRWDPTTYCNERTTGSIAIFMHEEQQRPAKAKKGELADFFGDNFPCFTSHRRDVNMHGLEGLGQSDTLGVYFTSLIWDIKLKAIECPAIWGSRTP